MPARREEVEHAQEEGIIFHTLCNPVEVLGDENGNVCGMRCVRMTLGEPDESGRRPSHRPGGKRLCAGCGHNDHVHRHQSPTRSSAPPRRGWKPTAAAA